jgi:hypothetical protein
MPLLSTSPDLAPPDHHPDQPSSPIAVSVLCGRYAGHSAAVQIDDTERNPCGLIAPDPRCEMPTSNELDRLPT